MKKIYLLIVLGILFTACSGSDTPKENKAPSKVNSLIYPTNNLLCISNVLDFEWDTSTDPDGDSVSYLLEISKDNLFSNIDQSFTVNTPSKTVTLEKGTAYYWRVKAKDSKSLSSDYSTTYQFYTEGEGETNHLPFTPRLVSPANNSSTSGASADLQWNCSDVDNDPLTYDVYFDTVNPPLVKAGDNQSDKSLNVKLNPSTNYYWKVIAKDGKGGESIGQVWSLSTD